VSETGALLVRQTERIAALESEIAALRAEVEGMREDAERFLFVFCKPRAIEGVFDATFDDLTQEPAASFRSINLTPIGREWDSKSDSMSRLRAAIDAARKESSNG